MSKRLQGNIMLLLAALIWGFGFAAQSSGMQYIRPFTFNTFRYLIGFITLIPLIAFLRLKRSKRIPLSSYERRRINSGAITGGIFCGLALAAASSLQQFGVSMTSAGKAGFLSALYIIIVPVLGIFIKKKIKGIIWICAVIALAGFYFMCIKEGFSVSFGDLLCLACAFCFSVQTLLIDHFTNADTDCMLMSCIQFGVASLASAVCMFIFETPMLFAIWQARVTLLYTGILSTAVAYTVQVMAQQHTDPAIASLLMSMESVFSVIGGWLILNERLSPREITGCILVFAAVILAQIPLPAKRKVSLKASAENIPSSYTTRANRD